MHKQSPPQVPSNVSGLGTVLSPKQNRHLTLSLLPCLPSSCLTTQGTCAMSYLHQPPSLTESRNTRLGPICPPTEEHRCAVDFRGDWQTVKAVRNSTCCLRPSSPCCPTPSPRSFRKRPREHPEADLQKASPPIWEGRESGGPAGAFDLSSYIEPGPEAVALNRQTAGGHGAWPPQGLYTCLLLLEHLPQGPSPLLPLALCSDAWLGLSQSDGLCFALGFTWRGVHAYRASSLVLSQEEKGNKVSASSPTMAIAEAERAA